jgi:hypothetical protein
MSVIGHGSGPDERIAALREAGMKLAADCVKLEAERDELRRQLQGAVRFTDAERERVLWWLRRPVHPGPMKDLDERIIRKLNGRDR